MLLVAGGGLAGCEAAWQAAIRGVPVRLCEMRPGISTPVHTGSSLGQLVCSNSLGGSSPEKAPGILKRELLRSGSLLMRLAWRCRVPAGDALAVDRVLFSAAVEEALSSHPLIELAREEVTGLTETPTVIATGPMTSGAMAGALERLLGKGFLYFFDATSPIVSAESLDMTKVFAASRYGRGDDDYLNCPFASKEYDWFYDALSSAKTANVRDFEDGRFFEGCVPVEELAARGRDTLRFGPLKPVGLPDPRTGLIPYAVAQLRRENSEGTMHNLVGFQTRLRWGDQERVFRLIPGLENAEFLRFGVMHRNIYVNSPGRLSLTMALLDHPHLFLAGQLTGVEGYVESIATGFLAGVNGARLIQGKESLVFPRNTALGSLASYICSSQTRDFQPMNINMGLFPPLPGRKATRKERNRLIAQCSAAALDVFLDQIVHDVRDEVPVRDSHLQEVIGT
jgi:methylenetetrahydrofolate--tRNA-(uracil-5-)-methyltransferase